MITYKDFIGLIIVDDKLNTMLIHETKNPNSKYKLYLHNLTGDYFVSTLFVNELDSKKSIFKYNIFDVDEKKQKFYKLTYNLETDTYRLRLEKVKKLTEEFLIIESNKRKSKKYNRKYKEITYNDISIS